MIKSRPAVVNSHFTTSLNPIVVPKCFTSSWRVPADFGGLGKAELSASEHTSSEAKQTPVINRLSFFTLSGRTGSGDSQALGVSGISIICGIASVPMAMSSSACLIADNRSPDIEEEKDEEERGADYQHA
jgi:hypothetical protein